MYQFPFLIILFLSIATFGASSSTIGSRSLLRKIGGGNNTDLHDVVLELNHTIFNDALQDTPASFAIVEFFAHWCPACRNYKPHFEKVARIFNGRNAAHPGIILMARVDCASKINSKLCDRFSVDRYPLLLWGKPDKFVLSSKWDGKDGEIMSIKDGRTAERLLEWINKKLNRSYGFEDKRYEHEQLQSEELDQITQAVYDVEEATSLAFDIILSHKMIKPGTKVSLVRFLQLLVAHHPSRRCRKGTAEILVNLDDLYPLDPVIESQERSFSENATSALGTFHICGKDVPRGYWIFCQGSRNDTRGFSCGLWVLLHSLSVRIEDEESHMAFTTTCDFIHNFFMCEECRQHFFDMCSRVSTPFNRTRDFALWLWDAHNTVNERLLKVESALGNEDPKYQKTIWPPVQLCSACYLLNQTNNSSNHINWNRDAVFKFLVSYYGNMLSSLYKNKGFLEEDKPHHSQSEELGAASNPVVVPIGAAVAIAVASCAFGALACVWRSRQKSRKYRHLHSLKNI